MLGTGGAVRTLRRQRLHQMRIAFRRGDSSILRSPDVEATIGGDLRFQAADLFGPRLVRVSALPSGWAVKAVMLNGADITDVPTVFTKEHDGQLQVVLGSRLSTLEGEVRDDTGRTADDAMVFVFSEDRSVVVAGLAADRHQRRSPRTAGSGSEASQGAGYFAIAVAREGFRLPQSAREAFFDLLSKEATPFVIGDDERRTLELRSWRWPNRGIPDGGRGIGD